jgi:ubiquinone/menaquinone biosynthesis C-methylase UbiE
MTPDRIVFNDGAGYERYMGVWSRLVGEFFLAWLAPASGLRWLDIGCGNGAFTEMIVDRCAPAAVEGVDPSAEQIDFARTRPATRQAQFRRGDAMALPYPAASVDVAVMPLVLFFVPVPATGVAEMARVLRPGGIASAYAWDMAGDGFPYQTLIDEMRAMGVAIPDPPSPDASRLEVMRELWTGAGLQSVETRAITVRRTYADFAEYWATVLKGPNAGPRLAAMPATDRERLKVRLQSLLPSDATGRITISGVANAVKGTVAR